MTKKSKKKAKISTIVFGLILCIGMSVLLYPTISNLYYSHYQSQAIINYSEQVDSLEQEIYEQLLAQAEAYNQALIDNPGRFTLSDEELAEYEELLSIEGTEVIGYIEIDKIDCYLPIYHGTSDEVLQHGVGHLEGTSLPIGGESTHAVISAHRGLPSSTLFTNLDQLEEGDTFTITVLDETLTYEIDQITVVEPDDFSELEIVEGEDYVTLMTCTPYGINTHRLLVRGHRIETPTEDTSDDTTEPTSQIPLLVAAIVLFLAAVAGLLWWMKKRRQKQAQEQSAESQQLAGEQSSQEQSDPDGEQQVDREELPQSREEEPGGSIYKKGRASHRNRSETR